MNLTPTQIKKAISRVETKWKGDRKCPICQKETIWDEPNIVAEIRAFNKGGIFVGGPVFPLFVISCKSCGYTILFNAIQAGILDGVSGEFIDD